MFWKRKLGNEGEKLAIHFLKKKGLEILEHSYSNKVGEVDIIARNREHLYFIEVKSRKSKRFGPPTEAVDVKKQYQISKAALWYLQSKRLTSTPCRFDVIAIEYDENDKPQIEWIQNAFELNERYRY